MKNKAFSILVTSLCMAFVIGCGSDKNSNTYDNTSVVEDTSEEDSSEAVETTEDEVENNSETNIVFPEEVLNLRGLTYGEYKTQWGDNAEFFHGGLFVCDIPELKITLEFMSSGFDPDGEEMYYMQDEDTVTHGAIRMKDLLTELDKEYTMEEFSQILLDVGYANEYKENNDGGANTAYYIGSEWAEFHIDTDADNEFDTTLYICNEEYYMDKDAEGLNYGTYSVGPDSHVWFFWYDVNIE